MAKKNQAPIEDQLWECECGGFIFTFTNPFSTKRNLPLQKSIAICLYATHFSFKYFEYLLMNGDMSYPATPDLSRKLPRLKVELHEAKYWMKRSLP